MLFRLGPPRARCSALSFVLAALVFVAGEEVARAQARPAPAGRAKPAPGKPEPAAVDPKANEATKPAPVKDEERKSLEEPEQTPANAEDARKDTEDKRAVYLAFDVGFTRTDIGGFSNGLDFDVTGANGLGYGLGAGVKLKRVRLGARWHVYSTTEYDLWAAMVELGYALPIRPLSPTFFLHLGYVSDHETQAGMIRSSLPPETKLLPDVDLHGGVVGAELLANYWFTRYLAVGPYLGADLFLIARPKVPDPQPVIPPPPEFLDLPLYRESGFGLGYALSIGVRGSFDIGF